MKPIRHFGNLPPRDPAIGGYHVAKIVTTSQVDAEKQARKWMRENGDNCFARTPIVYADADGTWWTVIQWIAFS